MNRLSFWLRPKSSSVVVFLCDPTNRLLKHINESLVLIDPTKQAVHKYLVIRLEKAKVRFGFVRLCNGMQVFCDDVGHPSILCYPI